MDNEDYYDPVLGQINDIVFEDVCVHDVIHDYHRLWMEETDTLLHYYLRKMVEDDLHIMEWANRVYNKN